MAAKRVVQPTDQVSGRFSLLWGRREDRKEDERDPGKYDQGLLVEEMTMKIRLLRLAITLSAIAATALAGGATIKGF